MSDLVGLFNLLAPFFGLIGLGYLCGKLAQRPEAGLAWMQFFLVFLALPCLFFRLIADKPLDQLANWPFIFATTFSTFCAFAISFGSGLWQARHDMPQAVMQGVAGAYSNIGYMGPPLILSAIGAAASAPVVLIFVFDSLLLFSLVPFLMAVAGNEKRSIAATAGEVVLRGDDPSLQPGDCRRRPRQLPSRSIAGRRRQDGDLAFAAPPLRARSSRSA